MRLTPYEIASIQECTRAHFGDDAVVRLFGSRLRDEFDGGDIDLHVTVGDGRKAASAGFREALIGRIGDDIDVIVVDRSERPRPIDQIAVFTGRVLAGPPILVGPEMDPATKAHMADDAYCQLVAGAVSGGRSAKIRIVETLDEIRPKLPLDGAAMEGLSRFDRMLTDSLLLQYSNLVAIVQD